MPQPSSKASEGAPEGVCLFSVPLIAMVARPEIGDKAQSLAVKSGCGHIKYHGDPGTVWCPL